MDMKQTFSNKMIEKYPDLFPKDEESKTTYPACGFYCPQGWETLVDSVLFYLNARVKNPDRIQTYKTLYSILQKTRKYTIIPIYNFLYRLTDPIEHYRWKDGKRIWVALRFDQIKLAHAAFPIKSKLNKLIKKLLPLTYTKYRGKMVNCPPIQIDQIKEKFGTLRIYASGGDSKAHEIISFTEALSATICQETGNTGKLVNKKGWYKTLSLEEARKQGFA